jgi:hypothetical protein
MVSWIFFSLCFAHLYFCVLHNSVFIAIPAHINVCAKALFVLDIEQIGRRPTAKAPTFSLGESD